MMLLARNVFFALVAFGAAFVAQADTLAYWPMNVTTSGSTRTVQDATGNAYNLTVRKEALGASSFSGNDIGWPDNLPPNPDALGAASVQMLQSGAGIPDGSNYKQLLTSSNVDLCNALSAAQDFTLEGYFKTAALPTNMYLFAMNTLGSNGGWAWQFLPNGSDGYYAIRVDYNCKPENKRSTVSLTSDLHADELLGKWNHFALVLEADVGDSQCKWRFYLNGRLRGQATSISMKNVLLPSSGRGFSISGSNSSLAQQLEGNLTCWRASDKALAPEELLCADMTPETVAYWTLSRFGAESILRSAVGENMDLTLRDTTLGGVSSSPNTIGWTYPPQPEPHGDRTSAWASDQLFSAAPGQKKGTSYQPVFSSVSSSLIAVLTPTNDFCIEGWYKMTSAPEASNRNYMFVYNAYAGYGGWVWNLYGADANGKCAVKVTVENGKRTPADANDRETITLGSVALADVLNVWNHYALRYQCRKNRWEFYLNGVLLGAAGAVNRIEDVKSKGNFYFLGCVSGTAQIPVGDLSTWRVSRGAFTADRLLCGDKTAANVLVWTGAESAIWSTGADVNWKVDDPAAACAWTEYRHARFDGTAANNSVTLGSTVNPATITVDTDEDVTITGASDCAIGPECESITKLGSGTLSFVSTSYMNNSANDIHVREGTLKGTSANGRRIFGDASLASGYHVYVYGGAKLWVDERNALGLATLGSVNNSHFTVYTNGVFDLRGPAGHDSNWFNVQAMGTLDLLGGTLIMPESGHSSGCLFIRDRVTFGERPSREPYCFNAAATGYWANLTWQIGGNPEFRVADITGDAEPDVVFFNHLLALTSWATNTLCAFRKTGAGTMRLAQSEPNSLGETFCYPNGTLAVEEGELRIDCCYTGSVVSVSAGAMLSGTGCVSTATLSNGARFGAEARQTAALRVVGNLTIGENPTIALKSSSALDDKCIRATIFNVGGTVVGAENLVNATVTLNGRPVSRQVQLEMNGGVLRVCYARSMVISIR